MSIRSESSGADRKARSNRLSQAVREHVVADAPPDHDEIMGRIPRAPRGIGVLAAAAAVTGLWTLIFLAAGTLLH